MIEDNLQNCLNIYENLFSKVANIHLYGEDFLQWDMIFSRMPLGKFDIYQNPNKSLFSSRRNTGKVNWNSWKICKKLNAVCGRIQAK